MVSAGEASGDLHCANCIRSLLSSSADITLFGMGGKHLASCGMELLVDVDSNSVMGFVEVVRKYPQLRAQLNTMISQLRERKPDLLLLVDYPGFNMRLAKNARELNIPVLYFIAPKVWASRPRRIDVLKQTVDQMAVILPFETRIYEEAGIPVSYVGNPVLDNPRLVGTIKKSTPRKSITSIRSIALLPGSRPSEIEQHLPEILASAQMLSDKYPELKLCLPVADTLPAEALTSYTEPSDLDIDLLEADDYEALAACDAAIVASGTATLELALLGVPMVVVYRLNKLSYRLAKRMLLIDHVSLVNIVAGCEVAIELIQDDMQAASITHEIERLVLEDEYRQSRLSQLADVSKKIGNAGAAARLSTVIRKMLQGTPQAQTDPGS
jgi:lipid-A-disaccharide synthase